MPKVTNLLNHKIEDYLTELIGTGEMRSGSRIPTEMDIAQRFNSSHIPVRQATERLIQKGILFRKDKRGVFVKKDNPISVTTSRIGILNTHMESVFFESPMHASLLAGVNAETRAYGKDLLIRSVLKGETPDMAGVIMNMAEEVDGLIVIDAIKETYELIESTLEKFPKPVVVLFYEGNSKNLDYVTADSRGDAKTVVKYLYGLGHRRIACINNVVPYETGIRPSIQNRTNGYRETLLELGLPVDENLIKQIPQDEDIKFLSDLINMDEPVTACFCTTTFNAFRIYRMAEKLKIRIPDQLSVIGYADAPECDLITPKLTRINLPLLEMGRAGVRRLEAIREEKNNNQASHTKTELPGELIIRDSQKLIK